MSFDPYTDPREEPYEVPLDMLSEEAVDGLIESYLTQYHGLNETEDPGDNKARVREALKKGELKVYFDPVDEVAALHSKRT